jgi:hypothetical protein
MSENVAKAAAAAGLPTTSIAQFVGDLLGQNTTGLALVPGVTPAIIGAGANASLDTYAKGFRNVWASAAVFIVFAAISKFSSNNSVLKLSLIVYNSFRVLV